MSIRSHSSTTGSPEGWLPTALERSRGGQPSAEANVAITVPSISASVEAHHDSALYSISLFKNTRGYGAEANLRAWRKLLTKFDPSGTDGWAFEGSKLAAGAETMVRRCSLIVGLDDSWAKGNWYAGHEVRPRALRDFLAQVTEEDGFKIIYETCDNAWAQAVIGFLNAHPDLVKAGRVGHGPTMRRSRANWASGRR